MKRALWVALGTGAVIASVGAIGIDAATVFAPQSITRLEYANALAAVDSDREQALARCEEGAGAEREICRAEAAGDESIRVADIEARFRRTQEAARAAQRARIEARYHVERARCTSLGGARRDRCQISAHAVRGSALMELAAPYDTRS
jgi:hypothetical protein